MDESCCTLLCLDGGRAYDTSGQLSLDPCWSCPGWGRLGFEHRRCTMLSASGRRGRGRDSRGKRVTVEEVDTFSREHERECRGRCWADGRWTGGLMSDLVRMKTDVIAKHWEVTDDN